MIMMFDREVDGAMISYHAWREPKRGGDLPFT
jgi:hypothetical protein